MTATALWAAVVASYSEQTLIDLTRVNDQASSTISTTVGESAAQEVIDLWPLYAQVAFDVTNAAHVAVGKHATIAVLWCRSPSAQVAKVEWGEVFGEDGMIGRVRLTGARAHTVARSNSGVQQASELDNGIAVRGWSDRESLPGGLLPSRLTARDG